MGARPVCLLVLTILMATGLAVVYHKINKVCGRPPQYAPGPCKLTLKVVFELHVTRGIPLCQF